MRRSAPADSEDSQALREELERERAISTELRDQQVAMAELLKVIGRTTFELQAFLGKVIDEALRLCDADQGWLAHVDGDAVTILAYRGGSERMKEIAAAREPRLVNDAGRNTAHKAIRERRAIHVPDIRASRTDPTTSGALSRLYVPMVRDDHAVGLLTIGRNEVRPFSDREMALVETFADQAAIAMENVRLFNETKEALERQTATSQVLEVISRSAFDLRPVLAAVVERAATLTGADHAIIVLVDHGEYEFAAYSGSSEPLRTLVGQRSPDFRVKPWTKAVIDEMRTKHIEDVALIDTDPGPGRFSAPAHTKTRTLLAVPLVKDARAVGALLVQRERVEKFAPDQVEMVETFARQATIAIENVRLFSEIQDKSRQLDAASRHKSEFLANMSHELRTPLNAVIGFADVLEQRMAGELNDKQLEYVRDISTSGKHLLDLVNEILDLSKIEAGRMELEPSEFGLAETVHAALAFVRERAARHRIELSAEIPIDLGTVVADQRKVRQVLLNLLSNAVKFTPDGGWIGVTGKRVDSEVMVSVRDTGIGIAPEDQPKVFEEFHQVGRASERAREGTGLGLTLAKRFVELHGGRIWLESEVGKGTTFTFAIPVVRSAQVPA